MKRTFAVMAAPISIRSGGKEKGTFIISCLDLYTILGLGHARDSVSVGWRGGKGDKGRKKRETEGRKGRKRGRKPFLPFERTEKGVSSLFATCAGIQCRQEGRADPKAVAGGCERW